MSTCVRGPVCMEVKGQFVAVDSLLLPQGLLRPNSGCQACWLSPLLTKPSYFPNYDFFLNFKIHHTW